MGSSVRYEPDDCRRSRVRHNREGARRKLSSNYNLILAWLGLADSDTWSTDTITFPVRVSFARSTNPCRLGNDWLGKKGKCLKKTNPSSLCHRMSISYFSIVHCWLLSVGLWSREAGAQIQKDIAAGRNDDDYEGGYLSKVLWKGHRCEVKLDVIPFMG